MDATGKRCFPPVVDANTRILILGSLPGEVSLQHGQYYAHRQNRFWMLVGEIIRAELVTLDYPARLQALQEHGIGLWDVVAEAQRNGSLDSNIREASGNDLAGLLPSLPALAAIAFNGATAAKIGLKQLGALADDYRIFSLPSSSPAHTMPYATKLSAWIRLQDVLR